MGVESRKQNKNKKQNNNNNNDNNNNHASKASQEEVWSNCKKLIGVVLNVPWGDHD